MEALEKEIVKQLDSLYPNDKKARMISINVERLALLLKKATMNKMSDELIERVLN